MEGLINGKPVTFEPDETILTVARRNGQFIPTLCEVADLDHAPGTCRVCLVDIQRQGSPNHHLVTSCDTPMEEGMAVLTRTREVRDAQRLQVELLLADHNQDCATCVRHGRCELQDVAQFVGLKQTRYVNPDYYRPRSLDLSSPAILRDMSKCIRCGRCVKVCREVQGINALVPAEKGLLREVGVRDADFIGDSVCVACGQCTLVCPTGALSERDDTEKVIDFCYDPDIFTVVQFAPAVRVALGDEFYLPPGTNVQGKMATALKQLGIDAVLDTNFTADLVIIEEGHELLKRLRGAGPLPHMTSCSPGWVGFLEKFHPELIPNLSSVKSPQQCFGALARTYLADRMGVDPRQMRIVSLMPCTAKKEEALRPEFQRDGQPDVDVVLTTREFARLLKREGIWLPDLPESSCDNPWMGAFSGAGEIFGTTGGVTEAAVRTLYFLVHGQELPDVVYNDVRGIDNRREASVDLGPDLGVVNIAIAHGLKAARELVEDVVAGKVDYHFIEMMGCPGGCMGGGGQPRGKKTYQSTWRERQQSIYTIDAESEIRQSHNNPLIQKLYDDFLGEPNGEKAHELLHTRYRDRSQHVQHTIKEIWREIRG